MLQDKIIKAITADGLSIIAASTAGLVEKARQTHFTTPVCSAALGRTLTAGAIMGTGLKSENNKLTIIIKGDGPAGSIVVTTNGKGIVKGYVDNPLVDIPIRENDHKLDVSGAIGKNGFITVIKDLGLKEPYVGKTELLSGEIAEDIAYYYVKSEQQPSVVSLGVLVDKDQSILSSGGIFIQPLPGCTEESLSYVESIMPDIAGFNKILASGKEPKDAIIELFKPLDPQIIDELTPEFICDCSRERIEKVIISLGENEINSMIEADEEAEVVCQFCNKAYKFNNAELEDLLAKALEKK